MMTATHKKSRRIIIAGGGTGGHIFPAIAIANALKQQDPALEILFVGAKGKMEMEKIPQAGFEIVGIDITGFNRSSLIKNFGLPWKLVKSFIQVRKIFKQFTPVAVIGVGGYSTFPVLRFAQAKRIPSFIHESNSFAGKSNKLLGRKATRIFVATENMEAFFPADKLVVTGNPVRPAIVAANTIDKNTALAFFSLEAGKKTVLFVGGSLGARSINEAVKDGLAAMIENNLQVIWQTGKNDAAAFKASAAGQANVWVNEFISQMEYAYAAADVVVSRAGAMAIAELCVVKKPVLFVPYPFAAEDHQAVNARYLVQKNAALMIADSEANAQIIPTVLNLVSDEEKMTTLKNNIGQLAIRDADKKIAAVILKEISHY